MTQKDRILARLRQGTWFSTVECVRDFHILRLGARIFDLRADGHNIIERKVEGRSWSEYKLMPVVVPELPPAFPADDSTIEAHVPTSPGWRCDRPNCGTQVKHTHSVYSGKETQPSLF